ncbi:16S rRNA (cytosine(967)-C(5))-methyltransferase RsmB [Oscillospiraceae bacterium LTW-04]|nr:16S rRNA (cytosine(967)-C(5))-methyltransferase RsmB [Oscillospiraceae bacterium MB24-C1]
METARQVAAKALLRVDRGGYSQLTLDAALNKARLSVRDAAFASALFYGALERQLTLDHCIAKYARHSLSDTVSVILRLAFYQLVFMDSVPNHAAVDEAVNMTKAMGQRAASGMVNGMLRSFLRDDCAIPPISGSLAARLAVEYSCNEGLIALFLAWHGEEKTRLLLSASMGRPPIYIRVNTLKTDAETLLTHLSKHDCKAVARPLDGNCIEIEGDAVHTVSHKLGFFHVQDVCSQQAALTLEARPDERILDVCAAPGSKSFVLAQQMQNRGEIISCDIAPARLELIKQGAKRLGINIITTQVNDGAEKNEGLGQFDRILCDVPCSGLGVLRRKPEIKYRSVQSLEGLPELQYKILKTSANYLKADGILVYSTCTLNPDENERVVESFLREHPDFSPAPFDGTDWNKTFLPQPQGGDGFFISRIRRDR